MKMTINDQDVDPVAKDKAMKYGLTIPAEMTESEVEYAMNGYYNGHIEGRKDMFSKEEVLAILKFTLNDKTALGIVEGKILTEDGKCVPLETVIQLYSKLQ